MLTDDEIYACLAFAADREHKLQYSSGRVKKILAIKRKFFVRTGHSLDFSACRTGWKAKK